MADKKESEEHETLEERLASVTISDDRDDAPQAATGGGNGTSPEDAERMECAICLLQCTLPLSLPCGHTFCYLCAKGIAFRSRRCALCRKPIPDDVINKPHVDSKQVGPVSLPASVEGADGQERSKETAAEPPTDVWYYEGHNGWWQYDPRTNREIEKAFLAKEACCEVLIAGFMYSIDLEAMSQARTSQNTRQRRIRRNLTPDAVCKGVAGVPFSSSESASRSSA